MYGFHKGKYWMHSWSVEAHSPEQTLRRGYALVENQDKQLIRQTNQVHAGEKLKIRVSDGCFYVRDDTPQ